jgi:hypothetical protein
MLAGKFRDDAAGQRSESGPQSDPLFWILTVVAGTAFVGNWFLKGNRS